MDECIRQIERIENRLQEKRCTAERELVADIKKRQGRLLRAIRAIDAAILEGVWGRKSIAAKEILERFALVRSEFPKLDEKNPHEFRKQIEAVHYLAEISEDIDPAGRRIARQIKEMQLGIGEWHDWQALGREVPRPHGKTPAIAKLLDALESQSLHAVLSICRRASASLLGQLEHARGAASNSRRKPPAVSESIAPSLINKKVA
jgi:CHAD domain-containing protein